MIDGMFITYKLATQVQDPQSKKRKTVLNRRVWGNFREHLVQMVKAYRNHPSVLMYQVENELVYINGQNRYSWALEEIQEEMADIVRELHETDPTRSCQVGGAGDLGGRIETNCPHYPLGPIDWYPENAYTLTRTSNHTKRWPWRKDKPWIAGESVFAKDLEFGVAATGDDAYRGMTHARRGKAKFVRMLYGGYRWAGAAALHPWCNLSMFEDGQKAFHPLLVVPRKQTYRLYAEKTNRILVKAMNDTWDAAPVTLAWSYELQGKEIAKGRTELPIEPGFGKEYSIVIDAPPTRKRLEGTLRLRATQPGNDDVYSDERSIPVLPVMKRISVAGRVILFDRSGTMKGHLVRLGVAFEEAHSLGDLKRKNGLLLVGPDTLTEQEAFRPDLLMFALRGGRALVLEQENPLGGNGLPVRINTSSRFGGYAFPQALGRPAFRDLSKDDLIDWAGDHPTYKSVYWKPASGARSLAHAGEKLQFSPLLEVGCGKGAITLCQLRVGAKLGVDPAAGVLFRNLLEQYDQHKPADGVAAVYAPGNPRLLNKVLETGLLVEPTSSLEAAIDARRYRVAVVEASPQNLAALQAMKEKALAFQRSGGWVMLCGLTPEGLPTFNQLVGANHILRPFRVERVTLADSHSPLAATLGNRDVALFSGKVIQHGRVWVSGNTFSHVIDGLDVAPFAQMPNGPKDPYEYQPKFHDSDPYNYVNGMLASDHWRYIRQLWVDREAGKGLAYSFQLRRPETIGRINIWNNVFYSTIEKLDIVFDGDERTPLSVTLPDSGDQFSVKLPQPRKVQQSLTLRIRTWRVRPHKHPDAHHLVGIDNLQFLRAEPPPNAVFLDSAGGLVAFPKGKGGLFLNQTKFLANEPNQVNLGKKSYLLSVLLGNMGVGAQVSAIAVAGHNVKYEPIELTKHCNHFLRLAEAKGDVWPWFCLHRNIDLSGLSRGRQHLADVLYHVVDYATAPVPDFILIRGTGERNPARKRFPTFVKGIPVGRKADVLFSLQAGSIRGLHAYNELPKLKTDPDALPEVARYVLHYADDQTATIRVLSERHVTNYLQKGPEPKIISGADVAWWGPGKYGANRIQAIYSMKARNPRPEVEIESIDVVEGWDDARNRPTNRGLFAVLGITVGKIVQ